MFIRRRIGAVLLAITSALYTLIFIWGASGLGYWGLLSIGDFRAPGAIDYSVIGGAVLFTAATVYLGIQGIKRDPD